MLEREFDAWHRTPGDGQWDRRIRAVRMSDPAAQVAAKHQVRDFLENKPKTPDAEP